ncbi:hypothetical protein F4779DRAFT_617805 [Xylariaceae sp. FL0662B]|nr:hypothetical protein F4779DRAFT_617805 [Xylariaceae sp. FL0662B]
MRIHTLLLLAPVTLAAEPRARLTVPNSVGQSKLVNVLAVSCYPGEVQCEEGCMPSNGVCCNDNTNEYCKAGYYCIPNACCLNGEVCDDYTGGDATCDIGETECGDLCMPMTGTCCDGKSYCPNFGTCLADGFCCALGDDCDDDDTLPTFTWDNPFTSTTPPAIDTTTPPAVTTGDDEPTITPTTPTTTSTRTSTSSTRSTTSTTRTTTAAATTSEVTSQSIMSSLLTTIRTSAVRARAPAHTNAAATITSRLAARQIHQSTTQSTPYKDDMDRESLKPRAHENTQAGTDEQVAHNPDAAYNPNKTDPETEKEAAGAENNGNPLNGSPANKEFATANQGSPEDKRRGGTAKRSSVGNPPKKGKVV